MVVYVNKYILLIFARYFLASGLTYILVLRQQVLFFDFEGFFLISNQI